MDEYTGWLLNLYAQSDVGVVVWILSETGERLRATKPFQVTFYAAGEEHQLRTLWRYLVSQPAPVELARTRRRDLFEEAPLTVLAATVPNSTAQRHLFWDVSTGWSTNLPLVSILTWQRSTSSPCTPASWCTSILPPRGLDITQSKKALISQTLEPLLEKRVALKEILAYLPLCDC